MNNLAKTIIMILGAILIALIVKMCLTQENPTVKMDPKNTTLETIHARKSVRAFTQQKVSAEQVDTLLRAAMAAPTAVNKQPWAFIVVNDRAMLDTLAAQLPYAKMLESVGVAIIVCGDTTKALMDVDQSYWVQDCSAASENLLLAAQSMGLGAVWTGVFPRLDRVEMVKRTLKLPEHIIPLNVIPIGYPANPDEPAKDKYKSENIHLNGW